MFISLIVTGALYLISLLLNFFGIIQFSLELKLATLIVPFIIFIAVPFSWYLFLLINTKYYFFRTHVQREFKFITVKKYSVVYNKITNIALDISVWDRISNAGDVVIHTAEDNVPDLVLKYISNPEKVEQQIYTLVRHSHLAPQMQPLQNPLQQTNNNPVMQTQKHHSHPNHYQGHRPHHQNR